MTSPEDWQPPRPASLETFYELVPLFARIGYLGIGIAGGWLAWTDQIEGVDMNRVLLGLLVVAVCLRALEASLRDRNP